MESEETTHLHDEAPPIKLDWQRFTRVFTYFATTALAIIWWEIVLRRLLGEQRVGRERMERFQRHTHRFRKLAVEMGGVMIKLGQFLSARVDVLPDKITRELAGLQDEVPAEDTDKIIGVIEQELGQPLEALFEQFERECQAAASLGQVHRARLTNGERVAVKVQRPGIKRTVATDLAVLRQVAGWLMHWPLVSKRANVPDLLEEFAATLWEELDYVAEADNLEQFHMLFEHDIGIYIPEVYRSLSSQCVLTMEDVTTIKINDHAAIDAAGIDRKVVALRLAEAYLRMCFDYNFFHADPHPGNLFVYPLPEGATRTMYGKRVGHAGRPFYLVFVDFGMVGRITPEMRAGLRELILGIGTRDPSRIVQSYQTLGILLPTDNTDRLEEVTGKELDYVWGKTPRELAQMSHAEMREMAHQYRDLFYELPFQVPQNFIYLGRAVGILSGMCTALDPEFNAWDVLAKYTRKLLAQTSMADGGAMIQVAFGWLGELVRGGNQSSAAPRPAKPPAKADAPSAIQTAGQPAGASDR
jgi:predicted unusual protein kinase regulating ubiquinone biosynthesis (AarF/ABC1/UbiB family)